MIRKNEPESVTLYVADMDDLDLWENMFKGFDTTLIAGAFDQYHWDNTK